jgi:hypothetical protein
MIVIAPAVEGSLRKLKIAAAATAAVAATLEHGKPYQKRHFERGSGGRKVKLVHSRTSISSASTMPRMRGPRSSTAAYGLEVVVIRPLLCVRLVVAGHL